MQSARNDIGQLFVIGVPDEKPSEAFLAFLNQHQIGGVILFEHNCHNYATVQETVRLIKQQYHRAAPLIAVDQEGGRVCRLRGAPAEFQAPADYAKDNQVERYVEDYARAAVYIESLGINLNFAPVADLMLSESNSCLDGRCFGSTPEQAIPFIQKTIALSRTYSLLSCAKHFPGLGAATIDPHVATAEADYTYDQWRTRERATFAAAIAAGVDLIMTTHVRVPNIDAVIATRSERIVQEMLRTDLGFQGVIVTDDLCMAGAGAAGDIGERAIAAFNAGHDLLLFGKDFQASQQAYGAFASAVDWGTISPDLLRRSLERVASAKCKLARPANHLL